MQDPGDEIDVDCCVAIHAALRLTAEGKLFWKKRADEAVDKVRALARGEFGEYRIAGRRLLYRALMNSTESQTVGVARATKGT